MSIAVIFIAYVAWLVSRGMRSEPGFATWHMFVTTSRADLSLWTQGDDGEFKRLNPWDYLPHSAIAFDSGAVSAFVRYLAEVQGVTVHGTARIFTDGRVTTLAVRHGRVVG